MLGEIVTDRRIRREYFFMFNDFFIQIFLYDFLYNCFWYNFLYSIFRPIGNNIFFVVSYETEKIVQKNVCTIFGNQRFFLSFLLDGIRKFA